MSDLIEERRILQRDFLDQLGTQQQFRQLFECLPEVYFYVKDADSRLLCANQALIEQLGCKDETEIIGATDYDFYPAQIADRFVRDDRQVMKTGQPLHGQIEMWYKVKGVLEWSIYNKLPLRNEAGQIVGLMGTVQSYENRQKTLLPFLEITSVVDYIRDHYQEPISIEQLAKQIYLSSRQLRRKFREVMGISPQNFLIKTRIQAASNALTSSEVPISEIAQKFGFCDQSAFSQQFRKQTGLTPLKYRHKYAKLSDAN